MGGLAELPQWAADDHDLAFAVFSASAACLPVGWPRPELPARAFFEDRLRAVPLPGPALLTGYYEPVVEGASQRDGRFAHALYALPRGGIAATRAEIEDGDLLCGHELAWLSDPLDAFMAQVQGSCRVRLAGGGELRLGYAGRNGHPYRSVGAELIRRGEIGAGRMSAQAIRDWCRAHPGQVAGLLRHNPSFVMFRPLDLAADAGPPGALGVPLTPLRSIAADPAHVPPGAPVWVETAVFSRLCLAQDTGSAIVGAARADLFCGTGDAALRLAGPMQLAARLTVLMPKGAA